MLEKNLVKDKIRNVQEYLGETEPAFALSDREIITKIEKLRALERSFQLIVDEILDINIYLIRELDLKSPDDFQSTFEILAEGGVIPRDFAVKIAPAVGLRNRIVHRYEAIDKSFFVESFRKNRSDFTAYLRIIDDYLQKVS